MGRRGRPVKAAAPAPTILLPKPACARHEHEGTVHGQAPVLGPLEEAEMRGGAGITADV